MEQIAEEHQNFLLVLVPILDAPEQHRLLARLPQCRQADDLVAQHLPVLRHLALFFHRINGVGLHPRHEKDTIPGHFRKPLVIVVAAVDHQNGARLQPQTARHCHLAMLAFRHHREGWQVAVVIQQQMQFDRTFRPPVFGPVKHRGGQIDNAAIQAHQLVLEPEPFAAAPRGDLHLAFFQQLIENRLVEFPRPVFIGICQRRFFGCLADAQMFQRRFTTGQTHANFPQGLQLCHLTKQHRHELSPTGEPLGVPLCGMLLDRPRELPAREQLQ
jgi:hypothetical protein